MKAISWNVNSVSVRKTQLSDLVKQHTPFVIGLQELKCETDAFPFDEFKGIDLHFAVNGQKTYNGVALLSPFPINDIEYNLPNFVDEQKRLIAGTINNTRVINVYVPNGGDIDSDKYHYKLEWLAAFYDYLKNETSKYQNIIVMGDFNIAPKDSDIYAPTLWQGKTLCSTKEREAFQKILSLGFVDALTLYSTSTPLYTWWDYRNQQFELNEGLRIDHFLLSPNMSARYIKADILTQYRELERPSDHAPVMVYFKS